MIAIPLVVERILAGEPTRSGPVIRVRFTQARQQGIVREPGLSRRETKAERVAVDRAGETARGKDKVKHADTQLVVINTHGGKTPDRPISCFI